MDTTLEELKLKIIQTLGLTDTTPDDIAPDAPFVGGPLGIDSIDILELVIMLEKDYAIKVDSRELGAKIFSSLRSLAEYVNQHAALKPDAPSSRS